MGENKRSGNCILMFSLIALILFNYPRAGRYCGSRLRSHHLYFSTSLIPRQSIALKSIRFFERWIPQRLPSCRKDTFQDDELFSINPKTWNGEEEYAEWEKYLPLEIEEDLKLSGHVDYDAKVVDADWTIRNTDSVHHVPGFEKFDMSSYEDSSEEDDYVSSPNSAGFFPEILVDTLDEKRKAYFLKARKRLHEILDSKPIIREENGVTPSIVRIATLRKKRLFARPLINDIYRMVVTLLLESNQKDADGIPGLRISDIPKRMRTRFGWKGSYPGRAPKFKKNRGSIWEISPKYPDKTFEKVWWALGFENTTEFLGAFNDFYIYSGPMGDADCVPGKVETRLFLRYMPKYYTDASKLIRFSSSEAIGIRYHGPFVVEIDEGSQADRAGVKVGWTISEVNGKKVETQAEIRHMLSVRTPNEDSTVVFDYYRPWTNHSNSGWHRRQNNPSNSTTNFQTLKIESKTEQNRWYNVDQTTFSQGKSSEWSNVKSEFPEDKDKKRLQGIRDFNDNDKVYIHGYVNTISAQETLKSYEVMERTWVTPDEFLKLRREMDDLNRADRIARRRRRRQTYTRVTGDYGLGHPAFGMDGYGYIDRTRALVIVGLPPKVNETDLWYSVCGFGKIVSISMRQYKQAFVNFQSRKSVLRAVEYIKKNPQLFNRTIVAFPADNKENVTFPLNLDGINYKALLFAAENAEEL
mmetsp:Transcript_3089/g.4607  ORF Transcript_3089/g.4607 Transcript_3089/m.4607 type:complete len:695 (+) Transcript_3089:110-2194(+)|eukprot:CAMPEP_0167741352 /NCGR_PEP_ID=MMETSP0110_2-20121227/812_1 /TAXON_ID=629695 /ORGANISM="Gymnochlora sp., Strain CCMP2014" /LENGTH=694 /DNA_ID=CAMNT_0007625401 /DNA_START=28 /DNA_END=2112 /DNA_ORIENTATION=+